jgi:prophage maintenance system killer protein
LNLNGYDLTLSDDERFELTMAVAATHASLHDVEVTLRQSIVPI